MEEGRRKENAAVSGSEPAPVGRRALLIAPQPWFAWRGSPIRVAFDALALTRAGWRVDLLVMPFGEDRPMPGVTLHRSPNPWGIRGLSIGPSAGKALLDVSLFRAAVRLARERRPAVVHGIEEAGAMAAVIARRIGARSIFEKHSDPASYRRGPLRNAVMWAYGRLERWAVRRTDATIGTGPALVEQARAACPGHPVYHIFDIPSSLVEADPARVAEARARLGAREDEVWAIYVGSFAAYQGIELLFESIPRVCRAERRARFAIVGGSPSEIAERQAALAAAGVNEAVRFLGHIPPDDLPQYLAAADLLLSPRIAGRNTPLKLLDYLKAGRAIVATDTEANRLILNEELAELAAPNPEAFAAAIRRLASDPARRAALGERGGRLIRERYNFDEFARRLRACYDDVSGPARPGASEPPWT